MLVIEYKCSYCCNEFWGPEIEDLEEGEGFCPHCGRKGTLKTDGRKWEVEISPLDETTKK